MLATAGGGLATPALAGKGSPLPGAGDPPIYWTTIQKNLATGLHTTVHQLAQLWGGANSSRPKGQTPPPATTIADIAVEHGISQARLRTIELTAIQTACNTLIRDHKLNTRQAQSRMTTIRRWNQNNLDGYSMYAFQQH